MVLTGSNSVSEMPTNQNSVNSQQPSLSELNPVFILAFARQHHLRDGEQEEKSVQSEKSESDESIVQTQEDVAENGTSVNDNVNGNDSEHDMAFKELSEANVLEHLEALRAEKRFLFEVFKRWVNIGVPPDLSDIE